LNIGTCLGTRTIGRLKPGRSLHKKPSCELERPVLHERTFHLNDYLLAGFLGIIEGLTEFLPISSTAHLRLCEAALKIDLTNEYWKFFSVFIQIGAILCLPIYFRHRIAKFLSTFPKGERGDRTALTHPLTLTLIAFLFTAVPAFLLTKTIGKHLESLWIIAISMIIGGVVMWAVDATYERHRSTFIALGHRTDRLEDMSLGNAIWIGACQTLSAVFPGTSRSMSTIVAGQLGGMSRSAALEFSFFLSIPTMAAATGYDLLKTLHPKVPGAVALSVSALDRHAWIVLLIGTVVSFAVAYLVVAWFMNWVRNRGFVPFAVYRIIVGVIVIFLLLTGRA
jgi:undecaprenyl-diphosphatase